MPSACKRTLSMFDPNFYDLTPGSIGKVYYKRNAMLGMSEEQKQAYVSNASNERMRAFMMNMTYGMNGNGPTDPQEAFNKARRDSWKDIEDGTIGTESKDAFIQIGQKESIELIEKIEAAPDFLGWDDPEFVNQIKQQYKDGTK